MRKKVLLKKFLPLIAAVILVVIIAAPVLASPAIAARTPPTSVASGNTFNVTIETSGCGFAGQVMETLPDGFTYISCHSCTIDDIRVEQVGNTVKFTFLGDSASFTYTVKAPTVDTTTIYTFQGVVKDENKNEYPIRDNVITVTVGTLTPETYTLTMAVNGSGSITPSVGNHMYDAGDVVSISATPDSGWQFDSWDGDVANPSSSSTTVTMDADKVIIANFIEISPGVYALTVACKPSDGGNVSLSPAAGGNQYDAGTSVELTAIPAEDYVFSCWDSDLSGSTNPASIIMDSDKNVIANFALSASESPARFAVSSLNISPEQVQPNQQVNISINITNKGEEAGSYEAVLYINGQLEDTRTVGISPSSPQNVVFSITKAALGTYTVSLGEQQGQFTVMDDQSSGGGLDLGSTIAIVVIVALLAAIVLVFRGIKRRRNRG